MSIYDWPIDIEPLETELDSVHAQISGGGIFGEGDQVLTHPGSRWKWSLDFPSEHEFDRQRTEAFITRLSGLEHRVRIHDFKRPSPLGTINLSGVTMRATAPQWSQVIPLQGCGPQTTMRAGDWFGVSGHLFMCAADAQSTASGNLDVEVRHLVRTLTGIPAGAGVVLVQPTALYALITPSVPLPRISGTEQPVFSAEFVERFL